MYSYERRIEGDFAQILSSLRGALLERGFGIISEIDVQKKFTEKLGIDFGRYLILGACNPGKAHLLLEKEPNAGVLLPCNVIIRDDGDAIVIACQLPTQQLAALGSKDLCILADEVEQLLKASIDATAQSI